MRLLLQFGLGNHKCEAKEVSVLLRAGCTGEGRDGLGEKSRAAELHLFLMREKYLPFKTEHQHNSK